MRRMIPMTCAVLALTACQSTMPNDVVRNTPYSATQQAAAERDSALTGVPVQTTVLGAPTGATGQNAPLSPSGTPVDASPSNPAPQAVVISNSTSISDENDFTAVSSRQSIESDAARLAANRQQYQVIAPTDLPTRSGSRPNIVAYALQTNNPVGVALYKRFGFGSEKRHLRNCASYASSELAQQDFLARGGPTRDRMTLDPDGDGYACAWDPTPFRAVGN